MPDPKKVVVEVVDAEYEPPASEIGRKDSAAQIHHRAARTLEALANAVSEIAPEKGEELRKGANKVRVVGNSIETAAEEAKGLGTVLRETFKKFASKVEMRQRWTPSQARWEAKARRQAPKP